MARHLKRRALWRGRAGGFVALCAALAAGTAAAPAPAPLVALAKGAGEADAAAAGSGALVPAFPVPRPAAPHRAPRPGAGPHKAAHAEAASRPPRPRRRVPPSCTEDGAHCISPMAFTRDVCRTIAAVAGEAGIDPHFFARLVWQESLFDPYAISPAGALGIAQFIPETARRRGLADPFNPAQALQASAFYLADLTAQFGNVGMAAVAYNGGEGRAERFIARGGALPGETRHYVRRITGLPAERWRDDPPERHSLALDPGASFQSACLEKASGRGFRGPAAAPRWYMIYAAHPDRATVARRARAVLAAHPGLLAPSDEPLRRMALPGRPRPYFIAGVPHLDEDAARVQCTDLRRAGGGCMVLRD